MQQCSSAVRSGGRSVDVFPTMKVVIFPKGQSMGRPGRGGDKSPARGLHLPPKCRPQPASRGAVVAPPHAKAFFLFPLLQKKSLLEGKKFTGKSPHWGLKKMGPFLEPSIKIWDKIGAPCPHWWTPGGWDPLEKGGGRPTDDSRKDPTTKLLIYPHPVAKRGVGKSWGVHLLQQDKSCYFFIIGKKKYGKLNVTEFEGRYKGLSTTNFKQSF